MAPNSAPGFRKHPNHRVDIVRATQRVEVEIDDVVIAASDKALLVSESRHDPVYYLPRTDVQMELLTATDHTSYCPFKGTARYWTIRVGERVEENAVWAYDEPYDEALPLRGYVAFYSDRVDRVTTRPQS
jgi:uncharacterized protein (DUF427 family)